MEPNRKINGKIFFGIGLPLALTFITLLVLYITPGPTKNLEVILVDFIYYLDGNKPTCEFHIRETLEDCDNKYYTTLVRVTEPSCQSYYGYPVKRKQVETYILGPCRIYEPEPFTVILFMIPIVIFILLTISGICRMVESKNRTEPLEVEMEVGSVQFDKTYTNLLTISFLKVFYVYFKPCEKSWGISLKGFLIQGLSILFVGKELLI
ncbi:hypothetical protein BNJ_00152 [Kaumoebavirus]|uniref:hypothetical protein n=1 Tax=Kaumoebavirus TaxID=1859492 RepID=UPI0009C1FF99|nr:hypothetical protein BNJ_00152 [Kaumoebavirus]ARA71984.1 hypothetical protein BNJ_00152 [Kaumoebavirus]